MKRRVQRTLSCSGLDRAHHAGRIWISGTSFLRFTLFKKHWVEITLNWDYSLAVFFDKSFSLFILTKPWLLSKSQNLGFFQLVWRKMPTFHPIFVVLQDDFFINRLLYRWHYILVSGNFWKNKNLLKDFRGREECRTFVLQETSKL